MANQKSKKALFVDQRPGDQKALFYQEIKEILYILTLFYFFLDAKYLHPLQQLEGSTLVLDL